MSTKPLQEYFNVLSVFANSSFEKLGHEHNVDLEKVKALHDVGCLDGTDVSTRDGIGFLNVSISPKGAEVLAEWRLLLDRSSFKGRLLSQLEKFLWVIVGIIATLLVQYFGIIATLFGQYFGIIATLLGQYFRS